MNEIPYKLPGKCPGCGTKTDPMRDTCPTCGRAYMRQDEAPPNAARCHSCGAAILWIKSAKSGKGIPVNTTRVQVVTPEGKVVGGFVSHFATCPQAGQHRKEKRT